MSNLTDLVPPLELCKLIPTGEFEDSCFVRCFDDFGTAILCERGNEVKTEGWHTIPAPTLEEILQELVNLSAYRLNVCKSWGEWHIDCYDNERLIEKDSVKNITTAALKLWLKMKGIEA